MLRGIYLSSISTQATFALAAPGTPRKSLIKQSWLRALEGSSCKASGHLARSAACRKKASGPPWESLITAEAKQARHAQVCASSHH